MANSDTGAANENWYHGAISRQDAELKLQTCKDPVDGLFLVRDSLTLQGRFCVSVLAVDSVSHILVSESPSGGYYIGSPSCVCPTMSDLINMYMMSGRPISGVNGRLVQLLTPLPLCRPSRSPELCFKAVPHVLDITKIRQPINYPVADNRLDDDGTLTPKSCRALDRTLENATLRFVETANPSYFDGTILSPPTHRGQFDRSDAYQMASDVAVVPGIRSRSEEVDIDYINSREHALSGCMSYKSGKEMLDDAELWQNLSQSSLDSADSGLSECGMVSIRKNSSDSGCGPEMASVSDAGDETVSFSRRITSKLIGRPQAGARRVVNKAMRWMRCASTDSFVETPPVGNNAASMRNEYYELRDITARNNPGRRSLRSTNSEGQLVNRGMCVHMQLEVDTAEMMLVDKRTNNLPRVLSMPGRTTSSSDLNQASGGGERGRPDTRRQPMRCAICQHSLDLYKERHALFHHHRSGPCSGTCSGGRLGLRVSTESMVPPGDDIDRKDQGAMRASDMVAILQRLNA